MPTAAKTENHRYYADLLWCCAPLLALSCWYYGARPAALMLAGQATAFLADCLLAPLHGAGQRGSEPSSACFAALIVLLMPASVPYYVVVAAVLAAVLAKEAFGGAGHYPFHPAAVGVAVAGLSWPQQVFRYPAPGTVLPVWGSEMPALTAGMNVTLAAGGLPTATTTNLLIGNVEGPLGTGAALVVAACGLFLLLRGHLRLSMFIPYVLVCVGLAWLFPPLNELPRLSLPWQYIYQRLYLEKYILLAGSTLFGGIFLASEPVTQPNRTASRVVYGLLLGLAATAFRYYSEYETGICFALLIAGAFPEWLDRVSRRAESVRLRRKEAKRRARTE